MDLDKLFYYNSLWRIIICKECGTVPQTDLHRHIRLYHDSMHIYKPAIIKSFVRKFDHLPLIQDLDAIYKSVRPLPGATPIQFLAVFDDGISCELCEDDANRYSCRSRTAIDEHRRRLHGAIICQTGRKCRGSVGGIEGLAEAGFIRIGVPCQTLFRNSRCRYYVVDSKQDKHQPDLAGVLSCQEDDESNGGPPQSIAELRDLIDLELA